MPTIDAIQIAKEALMLVIRNTNTRLYLLPVKVDPTERTALARENEIYMNALRQLSVA